MLAILSGLYRRLLGGWLSTKKYISERGVQWLLCALLYAPVLYFNSYDSLLSFLPQWLFVLLGTFSVIWYETKGHFPWFMCGNESIDYINEQLAKGREPIFYKWVEFINKYVCFEKWGKQYCFIGMFLRYTVLSFIPALFIGWQFVITGMMIAFVYNSMFYLQFPPLKKILTSPTNYGEFITGAQIFYGIL